MTSTPALTVENAVKRFDDTVALDGVDLEVTNSQLLALVGPSGCGKTTMLRTIAGLIGLEAGTIRIRGEIVDDTTRRLPPEKRHVGLVFQDHSLFPHLSVSDNVAFGIRNTSRRDSRSRTLTALDLVRLSGFGDRYPHELSGGERQRVALARALAPQPTFMLLDEPFASLDPNLRDDLRRDITAALRSTNTPAVLVTHDQRDALAIGDQVAVMRHGRINQVGSPNEVFHHPTNRFVAAFMGHASFLPVRREAHGCSTILGPIQSSGATTCDPTWTMVRPDDIIFTSHPGGDATVTSIEFHGTTWLCTIRLADGTSVMSTRSHLDPIEVGTRGRAELVPGHQQVPISDGS